jgi:group I intron endonuclease
MGRTKKIFIENCAGVYMLRSKLFPMMFYIGCTTNLYRRRTSHSQVARLDINHKLRKHIIKYGFSDLQFIVLIKCLEEHLVFWEQYYISELNPIFNLNKFSSHIEKTTETKQIDRCFKGYNYICQQERQIFELNSEYPEIIISYNI